MIRIMGRAVFIASMIFTTAVLLYILSFEAWRYFRPRPERRTAQIQPFKPKPVVPPVRSTKKEAYDQHMVAAIAERDKAYRQCREQAGIPVPGYEAVVCIYQYPNGGGHANVAEAPIDWPSTKELDEALK